MSFGGLKILPCGPVNFGFDLLAENKWRPLWWCGQNVFFFFSRLGSTLVVPGPCGRGAVYVPLKSPVKAWVKVGGGPPADRGPGQLAEQRQTGVLVVPGPAVCGVVLDPLKHPVRNWVKARGGVLAGADPDQLAGTDAGRMAERRQAGNLVVPGPAVHGVVLDPVKNLVRAWVKARGGPPADRSPGQLAEQRQTGVLVVPLKNPVRAWVKVWGGLWAESGPGQLAERRQVGDLVVPGPAVHGVVLDSLKCPVRTWVKVWGGVLTGADPGQLAGQRQTGVLVVPGACGRGAM